VRCPRQLICTPINEARVEAVMRAKREAVERAEREPLESSLYAKSRVEELERDGTLYLTLRAGALCCTEPARCTRERR
jgi:hypothetical protein